MKKYLFLFLAICILQLMALNVSAQGSAQPYSTVTDASGNVFVTGKFNCSSITFGTTTLTNNGSYDIYIVTYDKDGNVKWAKSAGGSNDEFGYSIVTDGSGNVYVTGSFVSSTITFGTIVLTNAANGTGDGFIVKYDPTGNVVWAQRAGGILNDSFGKLVTDDNGNVYMSGGFTSPSITFGTTTLTNKGSYDMYIVKYDKDGNVKWAKSAGGSSDDYGESIATDVLGNVYVTGMFNSSSITFGKTILYNAGTSSLDMFVVKYDASGNVLWAKSAGGTGSDSGGCVAIGASGDVYVTGTFGSPSIAFGNNITLTNADNSGYMYMVDMFIVKYGADGNAVWAKNAGGRSNGWGIATHGIEGSENVFVTGTFGLCPSVTFGNITLKNSGISDIFIVTYDASGNVLWAKSAGGTDEAIARSIATDGSGNAYVTGNFNSPSITFGTITLSNTNNSNTIIYADMFLAKYDPNGNVLWAKCVGGTISKPGPGHPKSTNAGINDVLTNEINIYPNPTSGKVTLSTGNSQASISSISVFNMVGKEVLSQQSAVGSRQ